MTASGLDPDPGTVAALAIHAGIKPWEVHYLTSGERDALIDRINQMYT